MMDYNTIYTPKRYLRKNTSHNQDPRSEYQRDIDRIIFSSAFRRLQNKTQVFPFHQHVFVHNRLTHSLELSSVGRSIASLLGDNIIKRHPLTEESIAFYKHDLKNVISAGCLCHDIGNPPFGHSGENAISEYFLEKTSAYKHYYSASEWQDLTNFEGNANAIRVLAQSQKGKYKGGISITFSSLASIIKYPCDSMSMDRKLGILARKKYGFFQSERSIFDEICMSTRMIQKKDTQTHAIFERHPFVYIVEAADDICYTIIDLEDAHRLGIIHHEEASSLLLSLIHMLDDNTGRNMASRLSQMTDKNEKISFLRAVSINLLVQESVQNFIQNEKSILEGKHNASLLSVVEKEDIWINIQKTSSQDIYNNRAVIESEVSGNKILKNLLDHFITPILKNRDDRSSNESKILLLLPLQSQPEDGDTPYSKTMKILDFISNMTDQYAMELYKHLNAIDLNVQNRLF